MAASRSPRRMPSEFSPDVRAAPRRAPELAAAGQALVAMIGSEDRKSRIAGARVAGRLFAAPFDRSGQRPAVPPGMVDGLFALLNHDDQTEQLAAMDALGLLREIERRRLAHRAVPLLSRWQQARRSPAARSRRWRASAIPRRPRSSSSSSAIAGPRARTRPRWRCVYARERMLADGSIALIRLALDDKSPPQPGARLSRRARRARAVILPVDFYRRPTLDVARDLIGKVLVYKAKQGVTAGAIVEVEAYIGEDDPACHAAAGPTDRNAPLYGPPGRAYVYLNYGLHDMMNAVTEGGGSSGRRADSRARAARGTGADAPPPLARAVEKRKGAGFRSRVVSRPGQSLPRDGDHARGQPAPADARAADDSRSRHRLPVRSCGTRASAFASAPNTNGAPP